MEKIQSYEEFLEQGKTLARSFLLLYKSGSETSDCALRGLASAGELENDNFRVFTADVSIVRDIHQRFGITSVPALILFEKGEFINVIKGCQGDEYYRAIAENAIYTSDSGSAEVTAPDVRIYTTPTCSWCNTLKMFLRKNNVSFNEIDVSGDEQAARDMVSKSGQQGVPQTEINGEIIVGFNQQRLKELLHI